MFRCFSLVLEPVVQSLRRCFLQIVISSHFPISGESGRDLQSSRPHPESRFNKLISSSPAFASIPSTWESCLRRIKHRNTVYRWTCHFVIQEVCTPYELPQNFYSFNDSNFLQLLLGSENLLMWARVRNVFIHSLRHSFK